MTSFPAPVVVFAPQWFEPTAPLPPGVSSASVTASSGMTATVNKTAAVNPSVSATSALAVSFGRFAAINATSTVTMAAWQLITISATSNVTVTFAGHKSIALASISDTSAVTAAVHKLAAVKPTINATSTMSVAFGKIRPIVPAAVSGTSTVTFSRPVYRRAVGPAATSTSALTVSLSGGTHTSTSSGRGPFSLVVGPAALAVQVSVGSFDAVGSGSSFGLGGG